MPFYETDLNPYIAVNPDINLPVDVLQAEGKALEDAYAKALATANKNAEEAYRERGVSSGQAADTWNAKYQQGFMDISSKLTSGQYSTRQAKDEILKLQEALQQERPMYDILGRLASEKAFEQGRKEIDAAKQSNNEAITPVWNEETGKFEEFTDLPSLERAAEHLGLVVNPSDWSTIMRKQALSAITPEVRDLYEDSTIVYKDFFNEETGVYERAQFLRSKDGKETRFTRDMVERDLGLNNEALFEQMFQSSKAWGMPDYFEKMKHLSPEEQRAKFREDLIQSTTGYWRTDKNQTVTEKRIPDGGKKGKSGSSSDVDGGPVAGVPMTIKIPGVPNPETGKPFKSEDINPRTVATFEKSLINKTAAEAEKAWGTIQNTFPGTVKLTYDEKSGMHKLIVTEQGKSNSEVARQVEIANQMLLEITAETEGLVDLNQDMLREAGYTSDGVINPLNSARNEIINPQNAVYYRTPNELGLPFNGLREGSNLDVFGITSKYEIGKVKEAGDLIRSKARENPSYRKLFMGELPMSETMTTLQNLYNETGNEGFKILEEGVLTAWATEHDPKYKLYKELSNQVIDGSDIQQLGSYLPRGAQAQEQVREAVLATVALEGRIQDGETGEYLDEDELENVTNKLFMTAKDEQGNSRKVFQGTPEARLIFNYSNPDGQDPFAAVLFPIIDGKRRKLIFDEVTGLSNLAIEGSIVTKEFLEESSSFVKKAASRNWTSSEHNGVHVDFSRKAGSGDMNFFLPEVGSAFKANTDEGLMKYINDIKELSAKGYPQDQVRKIALQEAPKYGVSALPVKTDYDKYYVNKLEKRQSMLQSRLGTSTAGAVTTTGEPTSSIVPEKVQTIMKKYEAESYDTLYGNAESKDTPFKGTKVTDMTLGEVLDFQSKRGPGTYAQSSIDKLGYVATPVGKYQFVGVRLKTLVQEMGLDLNEKFSPELQDKIFDYDIRKVLGTGRTIAQKRAALRKEWEGFKRASDAELDELIAEYSS
jgi:hypothetical protein